MKKSQQGVTILIVLILMSVMLLGGLALARMTEVGTLAAGNAASREASLQASEVGLNTAFAQVRALVDENTAIGVWYSPTPRAVDPNTGIPAVDFDTAPSITVGRFTAHYIVDRMCVTAVVTDALRDCLVRLSEPPGGNSQDLGAEKLEPPNSRQFRVTVRVTEPRGTQTWVQSLLNKEG